jgi:hypothetical protein
VNDATIINESLPALLKQSGHIVPDGQRIYRVDAGGKTVYAMTNSPSQAALAVCTVQRVTAKEVLDAVLDSLRATPSK